MNTCPYCLSVISDSEESAQCPTCGAMHHAECLRENGGCAVKNCEKLVKPKPIEINVDADPHTVLVLSRESVEQAPRSATRRISNPCIKCGKQLQDGMLYCPRCAPILGENQDSKNVGPLLVMIGVIALVVGWMVFAIVGLHPSNAIDSLEQTYNRHYRH